MFRRALLLATALCTIAAPSHAQFVVIDPANLVQTTLMAYRVGLQTNDQKFFHDNLVKVLETPPSIWPEQRLANEIAHRRARRYLSHEKDLFQ